MLLKQLASRGLLNAYSATATCGSVTELSPTIACAAVVISFSGGEWITGPAPHVVLV